MSMVPDVQLVFRFNGKRKVLNYRKLPFSVWSELKAQLAFTPFSLIDAAQSYDLEALGAIIWLERKQLERALRWPEVRRALEHDDVDFEFVDAIVNGEAAVGEEDEAAAEAQADPTTAGD